MAVSSEFIITTALSSGIAVLLAEFAISLFQDGRMKERHSGFLALEVCFCLERYAIEVADAVSDDEEVEVGPGVFTAHVVAHVPNFPKLPTSAHYDQFDLKLLNEIYALPDRIALANSFVDFIASTADHAEAYEYATRQAGLIGIDAMDLAIRIRKAYKLQTRELSHGGYEVRKQLENISKD